MATNVEEEEAAAEAKAGATPSLTVGEKDGHVTGTVLVADNVSVSSAASAACLVLAANRTSASMTVKTWPSSTMVAFVLARALASMCGCEFVALEH